MLEPDCSRHISDYENAGNNNGQGLNSGHNPKIVMVNILLEKEVTFDLPDGLFAAHITGIKPFNKQSARGKQDWIRILFDVCVPSLPDLDCRAGRNFLLSFKSGSDLRNFLTPSLGQDFFKKNSAKNIDLEKILVGLHGVVKLSHFTGEDYDKPLVIVDEFEPMVVGGND